MRITVVLVVWVLLGAGAAAEAGEVRETYDDGTLKRVFRRDAKGRLAGTYKEFHPSGKKKLLAKYKAGEREGPCTAWDEQERVTRAGSYVAGRFTGVVRTYGKEGVAWEKTWADGLCIHPRSADTIGRALARIDEQKTASTEHAPAPCALRRLKAYRYLAGVPYEGLVLDPKLSRHAQAACLLFSRLKATTNSPKNPGMPEEEFEVARLGAEASLLWRNWRASSGKAEPEGGWISVAVDVHMTKPGHWSTGDRARLLNPRLDCTGFGLSTDGYSAIWVRERNAARTLDWKSFRYPPEGLLPLEFYEADTPWSLALSHDHFGEPTLEELSIRVYSVAGKRWTFAKVERSKPLKLAHVGVHRRRYMQTMLSIVAFQPRGVAAKRGGRYWVVIEGIRKSDGSPAPFRWFVELM